MKEVSDDSDKELGEGHVHLLLDRMSQMFDSSDSDAEGYEAEENEKEASWGPDCCIFQLPEKMMKIQKVDFVRHMHYTQAQRWRYLHRLLERAGLSLEDYLKSVVPLEKKARECYAFDPFKVLWRREDFVPMLALNCSFVLESLLNLYGINTTSDDDHTFTFPCGMSSFTREVLNLENQLPFFFLESLYKTTSVTQDERWAGVSLPDLIRHFFDCTMQMPMPREPIKAAADAPSDSSPKHVLDFLHSCFLLPLDEVKPRPPNGFVDFIPSATKLQAGGIKIKRAEKVRNFLDIKFSNGVLEIPPLAFNDSSASFILNCVAYEKCYPYCSHHFSTYVLFMGLLIKTTKDVAFLCKKRIIDNHLQTEQEVLSFFNDLRQEIILDFMNCHLSNVIAEVNLHYRKTWYNLE